jgi:hypothetical protein
MKTAAKRTVSKRPAAMRVSMTSLNRQLESAADCNAEHLQTIFDLQKQLADEKQARENCEHQNLILAEIGREHDRQAADLSAIGEMIRGEYAVEVVNNRHTGQTLAQTLWMYLRLERKYQQEIAAMERRPWLRKVLGWLG